MNVRAESEINRLHAKFDELRGSFPWAWVVPIQQGDSYKGFPTLATVPEFFTRFEPVEGDARDQVPVDGIAERFVLAHAVDGDRVAHARPFAAP